MLRLAVVFVIFAVTFGANLNKVSPLLEADHDTFVVGGELAGAGQFPFMVSLRSVAGLHFCGGFIINSRWIGSTAHCTIGRAVINTNVVVGTNHRLTGGMTYTVTRIVNHPQYNPHTLSMDISLCETGETILFDSLTGPIALGSAHVGTGLPAQIIGWGSTLGPGALAVNLHFVNTPTISNDECAALHPQNAEFIFDNKICTHGGTGIGFCSGDEGGPVVSGDQLIGAVSWGVVCGQGFPDVHSRISEHRSWILGHTGSQDL